MSDFIGQVRHFFQQQNLTFSQTDDFGLPFPHFYFSDQQLIVHCIGLSSKLNSPFVWQEIANQFSQKQQRVVHLWEDVWRRNPEIVQSRLLASLGHSQRVPARLTQARRIDKATLDAFLNANHLQGSTNAKLKYGLFLPEKHFAKIKPLYLTNQQSKIILLQQSPITNYQSSITQSQITQSQITNLKPEILVAVASFSGLKTYWRNEKPCRSAELIRVCNLLNCTVVGGLDKLLKTFIKEINPDDLMTYADRDWSDGHSYQRLGFELIEQTPPQLFWIDPQTFERHKQPNANGHFVEIYNAGNLKFLKKMK